MEINSFNLYQKIKPANLNGYKIYDLTFVNDSFKIHYMF